MKSWLASLLGPFVVATLMFLPQRSHAGFQFGFMPNFSSVVIAPILQWSGSNIGIASSWHEVITLTNTGNAATAVIWIGLTGSPNFEIYYSGGGDTCSGAVLLPGGTCSVDIKNNNGGGQVFVEANDGNLSVTSRLFDCPGC